jgi:hypothetical protein
VKVLVACEYSGVVRDAFLALGHDAMSCDLLPTDSPGPHHQGSVFDIISEPWDLMIAHPPCTYLCNSGVRWLDRGKNGERMAHMILACQLFETLLGESLFSAAFHIPKVAVENPIQHSYARERVRKQDQIIQPWQFGHGETKATGLWLKGLAKLIPTNIVEGREGRIHKLPPGPNRWKERSKTFPGIARAMASQWG